MMALFSHPYDGWDFTWYDSAEAVGNQLYPRGIHLFFDFYSFAGHWDYTFYWLTALFWQSLAPFTLFIPVNLWFDWLAADTTQWDLVILLFYSVGGLPFASAYCTFKFCEIENGW